MEKRYVALVAFLLVFVFCCTACRGVKKSHVESETKGLSLEETVHTEKLELRITEFRFGPFLASTDNDEFLFPTNDTSKILPNGISFVAQEGFTYAVIAYKVKNTNSEPIDFHSISQMTLEYGSGSLYSQELDGGGREPLYVNVDGSWTNIEDLQMDAVQMEKDILYEFRTCIRVPLEIAEENGKLFLLVYTEDNEPTFTFKVR